MPKDIFEEVAADKSQLGFDYQDLVCLDYLIDIKQGESVGLEVFDDVHHARIDGGKALIQVKHSVNDGAALTNRDVDLWKTLHHWSKAIDSLCSDSIEFIFFTNKKKTKRAGIVHLMDLEQSNMPALFDAISEIKSDLDSKEEGKADASGENPIKQYVDHIFFLSDQKKEELFSRITFIFSADDIFVRLAKKIEFFSISEDKSLDVVLQLVGVFGKNKYSLIKSNKKVSIDYDTFRKEFQFDRIIQLSQDRRIDFSRYHQFKNINTIDPKNGLFAKQLADIDIPAEDITEHAIEYAATNMFIQKLIVAGEFSESENGAINEEVFHGWKSLHGDLYDRDEINSDSEHFRVARSCLRSLVNISIAVANSSLPRPMIAGKGIELSDVCRIGWRKDWKTLYGNKK